MNYQQARERAKQWCDAWSRGDLDGVMKHYADNVRLSSPMVIKRLVRAYYGFNAGVVKSERQESERFPAAFGAPLPPLPARRRTLSCRRFFS